jgi:hypothetical protein
MAAFDAAATITAEANLEAQSVQQENIISAFSEPSRGTNILSNIRPYLQR